MSIFDDYILLGFDFRSKNDNLHSIDAFVWEQDEDTLLQLNNAGYEENFVQFLDCDVSIIESCTRTDNVAAAFAVSRSGLNIIEMLLVNNIIDNPRSPIYLLERGWKFEGFDVADANGYFSIFGIDSSKISASSHLFQYENEARAFIEPANKRYPEHSPFIQFAIFTYEQKITA